MTATSQATIQFQAHLYALGDSVIVRLPEHASKELSSRGQVAVMGSINDYDFDVIVLEPDGNWGHWLRVDKALQDAAKLSTGDAVTLKFVQTKDWPEPTVPEDLLNALENAPDAIQDLWKKITAMARWEWVRWVNATKDPGTRARRVDVSISKMKSGKRRPCCFNLAACTDPYLSKNGRLMEPLIDNL